MIGYPCAKINLGLNVVAKRPDGYHNLETVFYPINLCDTLEINAATNASDGCELEVAGLNVDAAPDDNLVVKAYRAVKHLHPEMPGVVAKLTKHIPSQAGLGGGSSDCAFMIRMLNEMFGLGMSVGKMRETAATLGADCAFFIDPTPAFATGIGDRLEPADVNLDYYNIGVVKPRLMISTKEAFAHIVPRTPAICCRDIINEPVSQWKDILVNDFEQSVITEHPEIAEIKQTFYDLGAEYAAMSGSGSALFGIFHNVPKNFELAFKDCITYMVKTGMDISANQKNAL